MRRVTINLTPDAEAALHQLPGPNMTDRINRAIRLAAAVDDLLADGRLTVLRPDGTRVEVRIV